MKDGKGSFCRKANQSLAPQEKGGDENKTDDNKLSEIPKTGGEKKIQNNTGGLVPTSI